jgi:hypothetical protein
LPADQHASPSPWLTDTAASSTRLYLSSFNEVDWGAHFAAWEEPQVFSHEIRDAFRSLR